MGCIVSNSPNRVASPTARIVPINSPTEKPGSFKVRIAEAIKRRDPILFEKTLQRYQVKINELIGGYDHKRSILHHIAEYNFAVGMSLTIDYMFQKDPVKALQHLNSTDAEGNTPAMVCCINNASDTLDVILKYEPIELDTKNLEGKTALELALEYSSPCVNLLSSTSNANTKATTKNIAGSADIIGSPRNKTAAAFARKNSRRPTDRTELSTPLTSVLSLTRDTFVNPNTKLYFLMNSLKDNEVNFIDEEFSRDIYSIGEEDPVAHLSNNSVTIKWLRPNDFLNSDWKRIKVFEGIDLNDVSTSCLAGCDLYSALAAMTEFPQRLLSAFTTKEVNKYGAYSVKFLVSGIPIEIMLDDYFPCYDNKPAYSKPVANELWFLLLEKAFAKLYGNYSEIRNVSVSEALEIMTGMPSSQHPLKDINDEELWDSMLDYDKKNYIFCAGTYLKEDNKKNRIFTIINLYENKHFKIVKMRNHFQDFSWDGMFSDKGKNWTKELKEEVGYSKGERSCIYMELQEFIGYFDFLSVCHYQDGWVRNQTEAVTSPTKAAFFEITLEEEMELFISAHQKLPRYVDESPEYDISPVEMMIVEKIGPNTYKKIADGEKDALVGKQTTFASEEVKIRLPEGKYIIRTKVRWVDQKEHEFTLNVFSSHDLLLAQASTDEYPDFLEKVFSDAGSRIKERYQLSNSCEFISSWCGPYLWIYGVNKGPKIWNLEIKFDTMVNLKLPKKHKKEENVLKILIPPNKKRSVYAKRITAEAVEVAWSLNHIWE